MKAFDDVLECFLGSYIADNDNDQVVNLHQKCKAIGCRRSLKQLKLLHSHLVFLSIEIEEAKNSYHDTSLMEI